MVTTNSSSYRAREITGTTCQGFARKDSSTYFESVVKTISEFIVDKSAGLPAKLSCETRNETERIPNQNNFLERMEKIIFVNKLTVQTAATFQTASRLMKFVSSAESLEQTAQFVADSTKNVAGFSTSCNLCTNCIDVRGS